MLQALRQNTKIILWITVFFFILLIFLVWGADLQFGSGPQPGTIGSVNGEAIPTAAYQTLLAQNRQFASARGQDLQPTDYIVIEEQAWNSIIDEILLGQEAERRGLTAQDSEVRAVLLNNPPASIRTVPQFLNSQGQFDLNIYRQVVTSPSTPESFKLQLEGIVRATLPLEKMQDLIVSGAKVTDAEVREAYINQSERAKITYTVVPMGTETPEFTDAELQAHFEKTKDQYSVPNRANLAFVTIPRAATSADSLGIIQELREFAEEARLAEQENADVRYSDFATLALTFSDGPNADDGGLSAGYLTEEEMSPSFKTAVQGLSAGQISEPFRDGAFMHVVKVEDIKEDEGGASLQLRDLALRIQPSDSTLVAARDQLDLVREQALIEGLSTAANAHGLDVQTVADVHPGGIVPGLASVPGIAEFAVDSPAGTISRVYETNSGWFLVEVTEVKGAGPLTFEEVKSSVQADLLREKRFEATKAQADQLAGAAKLSNNLGATARGQSLSVQDSVQVTRNIGIPGLGREAEVMVSIFSMNEGEVSSPMKTTRGWVVVQLDETLPIDEAQYQQQAPVIRQNLLNLRQEMLYNAFMDDLRSKAKIEDFRI